VCVCVCVCVREREREREIEGGRQRVCVCIFPCFPVCLFSVSACMTVEFLGLVYCQIIYPQANTPRKCAILSQFHTLADTLALPISVPPVYIEGIRRFLTTRKNTHIFYSPGNPYVQGERYLKVMKESKFSILLGKYKDFKLETEYDFPNRYLRLNKARNRSLRLKHGAQIQEFLANR
jgi:hypothetical protein